MYKSVHIESVSVAQVGTGFSSHMSFRERVENVITYAAVGLIDWVAFHRCFLCDVALLPSGYEPAVLQGFPYVACEQSLSHCQRFSQCIAWGAQTHLLADEH